MTKLRVILWDQLSNKISSLQNCNKQEDIILMWESMCYMTHVKHHKKKIAFLLSAMRHFADELRNDGYNIEYIEIDDPHNTGLLKSELIKVIELYKITKIIITSPSEFNTLNEMKKLQSSLTIPIEITEDDRFLCSKDEFSSWAKGKKQLRMECFYREMRKKYSILIKSDEPIGGSWNYDSQNRKPPSDTLHIPDAYYNCPDEITQKVINFVSKAFDTHFGEIHPFYFAVTRKQALEALNLFIEKRLKHFGDYQDAMLQNQPWMYHSHISFYLNCGLLLPLECVKAAEDAYLKGLASLNAVEGFIRQIIGWREYIRGVYWLKMPEYKRENFFNATKSLPEFYWTGNTKMNCLSQCVLETKNNSYAHHIQRLMVLGNFALLAGISPSEVNEWFLIVYADAYEWVELPNVSGMILFADGGFLGSKPYAAGGSYINKMSNYCKNCSYNVDKKSGPDACPFNYLYWDFLSRNRDKLISNHRMGMMYKLLDKMDETKRKAISEDSRILLKNI